MLLQTWAPSLPCKSLRLSASSYPAARRCLHQALAGSARLRASFPSIEHGPTSRPRLSPLSKQLLSGRIARTPARRHFSASQQQQNADKNKDHDQQQLGRLPSVNPETNDTSSDPFANIVPHVPTRYFPNPHGYHGSSAHIRTYMPRTPGLRHLRRAIADHLWRGRPYRALTIARKGQHIGGRNATGRVTVRHRGGGHKRRIRTLDFHRWNPGPHLVERIEHDPGRSAHIALLTELATGMRSYVLAAEGLRAGDTVQSYRAGIPADLVDAMGGGVDLGVMAASTARPGNCMPVHMVPIGTQIFNVGSHPDGPAVFCRSAGTYATLVSKGDEVDASTAFAALAVATNKAALAASRSTADQNTEEKKRSFVTVKLQSGEVRRVSRDACCTIGVASNTHHMYEQLGKAGRKRWLGIRPTVRGVAMNAVDHPHGGGRGKSKGNKIPVSPWGQQAKSGFKTRSKHKPNKWVVVARPRNIDKSKPVAQ